MTTKMTTIKNPNHPKLGSRIKVEPIKSRKDVRTIKKLLADKPRDLCLFTLGVNTNLRASDLLRITVGQVRHLKPKDNFEIKEKKTKKPRRITLNNSCVDSIQNLLASDFFTDQDFLFRSSRGTKALVTPSVTRLVKSWCKAIHLQDNYGAHTLRKTFGYLQRTVNKTPLPVLVKSFNHSSQEQTLTYLCIQQEELNNMYDFEI